MRIRLFVEQTEQKDGISSLRFAVMDEGIGIPKENLSKIFNAYEQKGAKTAGKYGGSGLGLLISKQLVELMGGRLEVENRVGVGSRFYFTLPLPAIPEELEIKGIPAGSRARIVEEDPQTREYLSMLLAALGISCAEEAVEGKGKENIRYCFVSWKKGSEQAGLIVRKLRESSRDCHLAKPVDLELFYQILKDYLGDGADAEGEADPLRQ